MYGINLFSDLGCLLRDHILWAFIKVPQMLLSEASDNPDMTGFYYPGSVGRNSEERLKIPEVLNQQYKGLLLSVRSSGSAYSV